jgi:hypothetical protein
MSKSYNKTKSLKLLINQTKKNKLLVNSYVKKMFNFYKPILQLLEKEPHIAQIFSIKKNNRYYIPSLKFFVCMYFKAYAILLKLILFLF